MFIPHSKKCWSECRTGGSENRCSPNDPKTNEISFEKTEEKADRQTNWGHGWMNLEDVNSLGIIDLEIRC